jgi:hypothetical protein
MRARGKKSCLSWVRVNLFCIYLSNSFLFYYFNSTSPINTTKIKEELMRDPQRHIVSKVFAGVSVLLLFTMSVSALVFLNGSDQGYGTNGRESAAQGSESIRVYVVKGAGYFLESYSDFMLFLGKMELEELAGLDYNEVRMILNSAIEKMEHARNVYICLKAKADVTPYNPIIINELLNFNYDGFLKKNRLFEPIFDQVTYFLENGDIRAIYDKTLADTEEILTLANSMKEDIDAGAFPNVSSLWDLGQCCSKSLLFGQYVARVFFEITVNK